MKKITYRCMQCACVFDRYVWVFRERLTVIYWKSDGLKRTQTREKKVFMAFLLFFIRSLILFIIVEKKFVLAGVFLFPSIWMKGKIQSIIYVISSKKLLIFGWIGLKKVGSLGGAEKYRWLSFSSFSVALTFHVYKVRKHSLKAWIECFSNNVPRLQATFIHFKNQLTCKFVYLFTYIFFIWNFVLHTDRSFWRLKIRSGGF